MEFEWSHEKADANFTNHGIAFDDAAKVFLDPSRSEEIDDRFEYEEDRYIVIGDVEGRIL